MWHYSCRQVRRVFVAGTVWLCNRGNMPLQARQHRSVRQKAREVFLLNTGRPNPTVVPSGPISDTPICTHRNAVRVENILNPDGPPWAYLCLECGPPEGTELPAEFGTLRRDCCGTIAGTSHLSNCPEWKPS